MIGDHQVVGRLKESPRDVAQRTGVATARLILLKVRWGFFENFLTQDRVASFARKRSTSSAVSPGWSFQWEKRRYFRDASGESQRAGLKHIVNPTANS